MSRQEKINLIQLRNPTFHDLYKDIAGQIPGKLE